MTLRAHPAHFPRAGRSLTGTGEEEAFRGSTGRLVVEVEIQASGGEAGDAAGDDDDSECVQRTPTVIAGHVHDVVILSHRVAPCGANILHPAFMLTPLS